MGFINPECQVLFECPLSLLWCCIWIKLHISVMRKTEYFFFKFSNYIWEKDQQDNKETDNNKETKETHRRWVRGHSNNTWQSKGGGGFTTVSPVHDSVTKWHKGEGESQPKCRCHMSFFVCFWTTFHPKSLKKGRGGV